jgi:hypothetical protein
MPPPVRPAADERAETAKATRESIRKRGSPPDRIPSIIAVPGETGEVRVGTIIFIGMAVLLVVVFITVWRRNRRYEDD